MLARIDPYNSPSLVDSDRSTWRYLMGSPASVKAGLVKISDTTQIKSYTGTVLCHLPTYHVPGNTYDVPFEDSAAYMIPQFVKGNGVPLVGSTWHTGITCSWNSLINRFNHFLGLSIDDFVHWLGPVVSNTKDNPNGIMCAWELIASKCILPAVLQSVIFQQYCEQFNLNPSSLRIGYAQSDDSINIMGVMKKIIPGDILYWTAPYLANVQGTKTWKAGTHFTVAIGLDTNGYIIQANPGTHSVNNLSDYGKNWFVKFPILPHRQLTAFPNVFLRGYRRVIGIVRSKDGKDEFFI